MRLKYIIEGLNRANDENLTRPLFESIVVPEVAQAAKDWKASTRFPGVLIGGLALSFYVKPRSTMDVDILYLSPTDIPDNIPGFKRTREHSFLHRDTHVEVEVLDPSFLKIPQELAQLIYDTAIVSSGMKVASRAGLVALKLQRGNRQDQADIEQLIRTGDVNLNPFIPHLTDKQQTLYNNIKQEIEEEYQNVAN